MIVRFLKALLLVPVSSLLYVVLAALGCLFFSESIMENLFHNNAFELIGVVLIYTVISLLCTIISFIWHLRDGDCLATAKAVMIIKLTQIPAYITVFIVSLFCLISLFTIPFALVLAMFDGIALFTSGLLLFAAVLNAVKQQQITKKSAAWTVASQCFFCVDVIGAIMLYKQLYSSKGDRQS